MCRHFIIYDLKDKKTETKKYILLNYLVNSFEKNNRDGFFLRVDNKVLRTLSFEKVLKFILDNESFVQNAKIIHAHLRLATTRDKSVNGVHGWHINNYFCSHNGIVENKLNKNVDSLSFFELVFKDLNFFENIKSELETHTGGGSFFLTRDGHNSFIIASKEHTNYLHYINKHLLVINSNNDIHFFKNKITYQDVNVYDFNFITFSETKNVKVYTFKKKKYISKDLFVKQRNSVLLFENNEFKRKLTIKNNVVRYYPNRLSNFYDYSI